MCGSLWTWLAGLHYKLTSASHTHTENTAASYTQNAATGTPSVDIAAFGWDDDGAGEGQKYIQNQSDTALLAGGFWGSGASCGSRARFAPYRPSDMDSRLGARFAVESL